MSVISLHAYLDGGGELEALPFLDLLAESIVVDRRGRSAAWLDEAASSFRRQAGTLLGNPARHELATLLLWEAEAYENEDVALRFERALPRQKLSDLLAGHEGPQSHPHRLLVTGVDRFICGACGDDYEATTAVVVDDCDGLMYCSACIQMASLALGNGDVRDDRTRILDPGVPACTEPAVPAPTAPLRRAAPRLHRPTRLRSQVAALMLTGAFTGSAGLASAGTLPAPLQRAVHQTLARVGITVPEPSSAEEQSSGRGPGQPALTTQATKRVAVLRTEWAPAPAPEADAGTEAGPSPADGEVADDPAPQDAGSGSAPAAPAVSSARPPDPGSSGPVTPPAAAAPTATAVTATAVTGTGTDAATSGTALPAEDPTTGAARVLPDEASAAVGEGSGAAADRATDATAGATSPAGRQVPS